MSNPLDDMLEGKAPGKPSTLPPAGPGKTLGQMALDSPIGQWLIGKALPKAGELGTNIFTAGTRGSESAIAGKPYMEGVMHPETWDANRKAVRGKLGIEKDYEDPKLFGVIPQPAPLVGAERGVLDTAIDMDVDPVSFAGGLIGKGIGKLGEVAKGAAWKVPGVEKALRPDYMVRTKNAAELAIQARRAFTPSEIERYEGIVGRERLRFSKIGHELETQAKAYAGNKMSIAQRNAFETQLNRYGVAISPKDKWDGKKIVAAVTPKLNDLRERVIESSLKKEGLPYVQQAERTAKNTVMHKVSEAGKEAMFTNPAPHAGNIANRVQQREGETTLARAFALVAKPDPNLIKLTEHYGGTEHFLKEPSSAISKIPGYGTVLKASNKALDSFETGMRTAVFEKYYKGAQAVAAKEGRAVTEDELYHASAQARKIADYANTSGLTRWLSDKLGAPFPQWHINVMGQTLGDAMANPQRAARFFDAGHNINKDFAEPTLGFDLSSGKPTEEALKWISNPLGSAISPSSLGPAASAGANMVKTAVLHPSWRALENEAVTQLQTLPQWFIPPALTQLSGANPYNAPGTAAQRAAIGTLGVHSEKMKKPPAGPAPAGNPLDALL